VPIDWLIEVFTIFTSYWVLLVDQMKKGGVVGTHWKHEEYDKNADKVLVGKSIGKRLFEVCTRRSANVIKILLKYTSSDWAQMA
jgi:hypothetical protein